MAAYNEYNPSSGYEEAGVFELLTELCKKTAAKYPSQNRVSQKSLTAKMRAHSYELILKKSPQKLPEPSWEPITGLLTHYMTARDSAKNPAEYKRSVELKKVISTVRHTDFGEKKENVHVVLKLLVGLSNTVNP